MAAYLIARVHVRDAVAFTEYTARTPAIVAKFGGRFLVRGGATQFLEGETYAQRLVVIEFPSMDVARAFYDSAEYQEAKGYRTTASEAEFIIVQGV